MKILLGSTMISLLLVSQTVFAADDAIKYRKNIMSSVGGHTKALVAILKEQVPHKDALKLHANGLAIATNSSLIENAFKENTHGKGSEKTTSTSKIWEEWSDYTDTIKRLEKATSEIQSLAAKGELVSFEQLKPALKECGYCHRKSGFREK